AGTRQPGYNGDGIADTDAAQRFHTRVALHPAGNHFIADYGNNRVRRVDAVTRTISTLAGTGVLGFSGDGFSATAARLSGPIAVAVDAGGSVFVADLITQRVRGIDPVPWTITTVAGTGFAGWSGDGGPGTAAKVNDPYGLAVDTARNLYIADLLNQRVRRWDRATGNISTVAGTGLVPYNGDGIAATAANLTFPAGVALDAAGNLYVADYGNARVRRVDAGTGLISTIAGTGAAGYNGDTIAATAAQLDTPGGLALDGSASLFIADTGSHRVRHVDAETGRIATVAGTGVAGFNGDGLAATFAQLDAPDGLALNAGGNLLIADRGGNRLRRITAGTGILDTRAGTGTAGYAGDGNPAALARFSAPTDVAVDSAGAIFIADRDNHVVRRIDPTTGLMETVQGVLGYRGVGGNIYVAGYEQ
ncbi:MAG: hypothetical protein AAB368_04930, partial [bacterium]